MDDVAEHSQKSGNRSPNRSIVVNDRDDRQRYCFPAARGKQTAPPGMSADGAACALIHSNPENASSRHAESVSFSYLFGQMS
jgi:hypothetical protein